MADFSFCTTPYHGFENEVLRLRNRNRSVPQTRAYLDWRYLGQNSQSPPEIFWIQTTTGAFIGMAALIYRPYWLGNKKYELMVFGDISLDREYRGIGLADKFFLFIQEQIHQKSAPCALVIPNKAAGKVLNRSGWHEQDRLVHHVLLLNPQKKIYELVKIKILSYLVNKLYRFLLKIKCKAVRTEGLTLNIISEFSDEFDTFWELFGKENICIRDKTRRSLQWRYTNHPGDESFSIATCHIDNNLIGYLVYVINADTKTLTVSDLMVMHEKYISGFVKLFIDTIKKNIRIDSIRIILNEGHPYCGQLKKVGFSARKGGQQVQTFVPDKAVTALDRYQWFLTAGDKDV